MACLASKLVIRTLWMDLKTGTSLFMPLLYFYSSYNQLTISKATSFIDKK